MHETTDGPGRARGRPAPPPRRPARPLGEGALLGQVDAALARLEATGELAALRARWLGR